MEWIERIEFLKDKWLMIWKQRNKSSKWVKMIWDWPDMRLIVSVHDWVGMDILVIRVIVLIKCSSMNVRDQTWADKCTQISQWLLVFTFAMLMGPNKTIKLKKLKLKGNIKHTPKNLKSKYDKIYFFWIRLKHTMKAIWHN